MSHIALFLPDLRIGGAERVFLTLAKDFVARGHQVDLVLARAKGELLSEVPPGVWVIDLKAVNLGPGLIALGLSAAFKLAGYLRRDRPAALLSTLTGANLAALLAHRLARSKAKLVLREASSLRNLRSLIRLHLMRRLYPSANCVIALTSAMAQELQRQVGLAEDRIEVISNPIDSETLRNAATQPLDHPWFRNDGPPVVMAIGRLVPEKDFPTLIRAFAKARQHQALHLVILGEGRLRPSLENLIAELSLKEYVTLPGYDSNPYRWLARARLLVLSSLWEGYPNVVLEALALGVPVVATAYDPSIEEILDAGNRDSIVPVGDPQALASAIARKLRTSSRPAGQPSAVEGQSIIDRYLAAIGFSGP